MAFIVGETVVNQNAAAFPGMPAMVGQIAAVGTTGVGYWAVLWEGGAYAPDVPEAALFDFMVTTSSLRPAVRKPASGFAPAPDAVGMVIGESATYYLILTPAGYRYMVSHANIRFLDEV
jgi:hypothetical protein